MRPRIGCSALLLSAVLSLSSLPAQTAGLSSQDQEELAHCTLTMESVTRLVQTLADLLVLTKAHPDFAPTLNANPAYYGLSEADHRLIAHPEIVAIMARHDLTPHEFNLLLITWVSSSDALTTPKSGSSPAKLAEAHVNHANVAFRDQHKAEIETLVIGAFLH